MPELEEMRKRKIERMNQFVEVVDKIYNISKELYASDKDYSNIKVLDESDLSLKRLDGLKSQLRDLEKEKVNSLFVFIIFWKLERDTEQVYILQGSTV